MTKRKTEDAPDAVLSSDDGFSWVVFCALCPRALPNPSQGRPNALWKAREHLEYAHALRRTFIECERPGYRRAVDVALPLVVAHDLTLPTDRYTQ